MEPTQQGSLPFLDTLVTIQPDNTFNTTVYRKPTHRDQYLYWDSNHHITAKQSVYNTLAHRAKTVSLTQENLDKELTHIKAALHCCQFPSWALNQWEHKFNQPQPPPATTPTTTHPTTTNTKQPQWFPTSTKHMKSLKDCAKAEEYKSTSRAPTLSEQPYATPRTRTPKPIKQRSSTSTNVHTLIAPAPTLGSLADPWGKELRNISRPPPPYITTAPSQDTPWIPTSLTLSTKR